MKITNISLKYNTSIFVLLGIVVISGLVSYMSLPVESFPAIKQPVVYVAVPYVGVSPSDMETLVVQPIEDKLEEIAKIKKMTSTSREGYASIFAEFEPDVEVDEAVRKVREKVDQARPELPNDLEDPLVEEINFDNIPVLLVSIIGDQSLVRLKDIAEDFQEKFEEIDGVLEVNISGGLEREVQININPARLIYYSVGVEDIIEAIQEENLTIPGGSMESAALKWTVRVPGKFETVTEMGDIVVEAKDGHPVYLSDVADVALGFKEQESYSRLNGKPSVTLSVIKRSGVNLLNIADEVKRIIADEKARYNGGVDFIVLADQSKQIRQMVNDLENNIIAGLILVVFVLYFFMGLRTGLLVGIAIPLSMLISFVILSLIGYTLNMMVLFSLILALGMLVDNAVVIVENIYRHHQEGKPLGQAAREGTAEVGVAVLVSTCTTVMAFLPVVFWEGMIGEFMRYLPLTLIITLASSLFVGLVFNPVIAARYIRLDPKLAQLPGERMLQALTVHYEGALSWSLNHRKTLLSVTLAGYILMLFTFANLNHGLEFFPENEPIQVNVGIEAPLGTRVEASNKIVDVVEKRLPGTPDMVNYVADVGAVNDPFAFGASGGAGHKSQVTVDLIDHHLRSQSAWKTLEQVKEKMSGIPGAVIDVTKPADGPPTGKPVEIQIKGENFVKLAAISRELQEKIKNVEGITKLKDDYEKGKPELRVRIDREKAALLGLNTRSIANTIRTAVNGLEASEYRDGKDEYDITVRFGKNYRRNYTDLINLTIFHEGTHFPLANFASVELASGLSNINHSDGDRLVTVTAEAIGRSPAEVLAEVKELLADYRPPAGNTISFAGQDVEQSKTIAFLGKAFMIAIFLIFFLLVTEFNSITLPFVIMASVVLSLFGVFFGLLITFKPFGIIMTGIGLISLAGIVVNNAIVLIDYIQKLRERGYSKLEAIIQGGKTRLRPVLLTAITTILGLIPLTTGLGIDFIGGLRGDFSNFVQIGAESSQWWSGMGVVVIFGLLFATAMTLLVVPVLYYIFSDMLKVRDPEVEALEAPGPDLPLGSDPAGAGAQ